MPSLRYLGPTTNDIDLISRLRLQAEVSGTLTPELVDQQVTTALTNKATATYLGNASSQRVGPNALTAKTQGLIRVSEAGHPGGPLINGPYSYLNLPNSSDRPGVRSTYTIYNHNNSTLPTTNGAYNSTTEQQIASFTINGPSAAWYPIFTGYFIIGLGKGEICIKQSSRYIARAIGGNDPNVWFTCNVIPLDTVTTYTGSVTFTITRRAVFSPGSMTNAASYNLTCLCVPA